MKASMLNEGIYVEFERKPNTTLVVQLVI